MPTQQVSKQMTLKHIRERLMEEHGTEYFDAVDYWNRYELDTLMGHTFYPESMNKAQTKWAGYKVNGKTSKRTQVKAGDMDVLIQQCRFMVRCRAGRWQERQGQQPNPCSEPVRVMTAEDVRHNRGWANMTDEQRAANAGNFQNERYNILARFIAQNINGGQEDVPPPYTEGDQPPAYE